MPFLSVLCTYLLSRYCLPRYPAMSACLKNDRWVESLLDKFSLSHFGRLYGFFVLQITVVFVFILMWLLPFWLSFFLGVLVLLYSLGRDAWYLHAANTLSQLENGKAEAVWLMLESTGNIDESSDPSGADTLWCAIRKQVTYSYLESLFAVFFWFCVLGPAGALFFRLLLIYNCYAKEADAYLPAYTRLQTIVEWLPARYMALCFCLAGNFSPCFKVWCQLLLDMRMDSGEFLGRCLDAALVLDNDVDDNISAQQVPVAYVLRRSVALQELLAHTEIIGLVGLALSVLWMGLL